MRGRKLLADLLQLYTYNEEVGTLAIVIGSTHDKHTVQQIGRSFLQQGLTTSHIRKALPLLPRRPGNKHSLSGLNVVNFEPTIIGKESCIELLPDDEVIYACIGQRKQISKFVKRKSLRACHFLSLVFTTNGSNYSIDSAIVSEIYKLEPGYFPKDGPSHQSACEFWESRAFAYDLFSDDINPETITQQCPWAVLS